jgi:hypothetical protein
METFAPKAVTGLCANTGGVLKMRGALPEPPPNVPALTPIMVVTELIATAI